MRIQGWPGLQATDTTSHLAQATGEWRYGKSYAFPHIPTPQRRLRTNVQVQKTGQVTATHPIDLLTCAGHVVVPVHERALRVTAPAADVEQEESRDVEAIRGADEIENLPVEHRRSVVIGGKPARRVQDELDAYESHLAIGRLVDEGLRLRGVEGEIAEQRAVDVVHAHRPVVGTGDAT